MKGVIRSPFFYVGDKYKLVPQLKELMPQKIKTYIEPFVGGGSSLINTYADKYIVNDIDQHVIALHKEISSFANSPDILLKSIYEIIDKYNLSCSFRNINVPDSLKKEYKKTYYSRFNKSGYLELKNDYNSNQENLLELYVLLIYGFNHMTRFNSDGKFNLPVGNVDFNKNVYTALINYLAFMKKNTVKFSNADYKDFIAELTIDEDDFIFFDPPYLISLSEYNKLWNEKEEQQLYRLIDELDANGKKFGLTNLIEHKGKKNQILNNWMQKYNVFEIRSNYISFNDNSIKDTSKEVYVTNYEFKGC